MNARKMIVLILIAALVSFGCKIAEQGGAIKLPAPSDTPAATTAASTDTPQPTADSAATQTAEGLTAQQTQTALDQQATQTQAAAVPAATNTPEGPNLQTQQAQSMAAVIEKLAADGVIGSTDGQFFRLPDFDESMAQIQYLRWWTTDYSAQNFVITADTAWQSASTTANWPDSGCGWIFSKTDDDNYYYIFLALDGFVRMVRNSNGSLRMLAAERYGKLSTPDGDAKIMLIVNNNRVKYYVNDQPVMDAGATTGLGTIAMTLFSGTNKDFGTRCQMNNINLWIIE